MIVAIVIFDECLICEATAVILDQIGPLCEACYNGIYEPDSLAFDESIPFMGEYIDGESVPLLPGNETYEWELPL